MNGAVEQLQRLGFSSYEAQAYVSLLQRSPLNGYELARLSGIPRANVYGVLQKLEERGAVVRLEAAESTRYAPVSPEELIQNLRSRLQSSLATAERSLFSLKALGEREHVWNARGYPALLEHAGGLIAAANSRLLVALAPAEAPALREPLDEALARGVEVTTLCLAGCAHECGACRGRIYRYHLAPQPDRRYLVIASDESEVLAGEIDSEEEALSVRTRQRLLVDLAIWHIRNSIALAAMLIDLGDRLEASLTPETRAILASLGPEPAGDWLQHLRMLLGQAGS